MGFVEETGVAQHFRDARINPIYEGTNGIQALDLVARKLPLRGGAVVGELFDEIAATATAASEVPGLAGLGELLAEANGRVRDTTTELLARLAENPADAFAGATPYLTMLGHLTGGWSILLQALAAQRRIDAGDDHPPLAAKLVTATFYIEQLLPSGLAMEAAVLAPAETLMALTPGQFGT